MRYPRHTPPVCAPILESLERRLLLDAGDPLAFAQGVDISIGAAPYHIAAGDINDDGWIDAVTTPGNKVRIIYGSAHGLVASDYYEVSLDSTTYDVVVADFDRNTLLDIAVTEIDPGGDLEVLYGIPPEPDGTRFERRSYPVGDEAAGIVAGFFDDDSFLDLAVARREANKVAIFYGRNGRQFERQANDLSLTHDVQELTAADLAHDGADDLIVGARWGKSITILHNDAGVGFGRTTSLPVTTDKKLPINVAVADFDRNGGLDLAARRGATDQILIFSGTRDGQIETTASQTLTGAGGKVISEDFNGDGSLDLATSGGSSAVVFRNLGDGTFGPAESFSVGSGAYGIVAADVEIGGGVDLVTSNHAGNSITALYNRCGYFSVGFHLVSWSASQDQREWKEAIEDIHGYDVWQIAVDPVAVLDPNTGQVSYSHEDLTELGAAIGHAVNNLGMSVLVNPYVILSDNTWRGYWPPEAMPEPDLTTVLDAFWSTYEDFVIDVASMAQDNGADTLTIGTELVRLTQLEESEGALTRLIQAVDQAFSGSLGYAANYDEFSSPQVASTIWDNPYIDFMGIDAYIEVSPPNEANLSGAFPDHDFISVVEDAWSDWLDNDVLPFAGARQNGDGLPVVLTEHGLIPYNMTTCRPWSKIPWAEEDLVGGPYQGHEDPDEQLCGFQALMNVLATRQDDVAGTYLWHWGMDGSRNSKWYLHPTDGDEPNPPAEDFDEALNNAAARFLLEAIGDYHGDTSEMATEIVGTHSVPGTIQPHDSDWFTFAAQADWTYRVVAVGYEGFDPILELYSATDTSAPLVRSDDATYIGSSDAPRPSSTAECTLYTDDAQTYLIRIAAASEGAHGGYRVGVLGEEYFAVPDDHPEQGQGDAPPVDAPVLGLLKSAAGRLENGSDIDWFELGPLSAAQSHALTIEMTGEQPIKIALVDASGQMREADGVPSQMELSDGEKRSIKVQSGWSGQTYVRVEAPAGVPSDETLRYLLTYHDQQSRQEVGSLQDDEGGLIDAILAMLDDLEEGSLGQAKPVLLLDLTIGPELGIKGIGKVGLIHEGVQIGIDLHDVGGLFLDAAHANVPVTEDARDGYVTVWVNLIQQIGPQVSIGDVAKDGLGAKMGVGISGALMTLPVDDPVRDDPVMRYREDPFAGMRLCAVEFKHRGEEGWSVDSASVDGRKWPVVAKAGMSLHERQPVIRADVAANILLGPGGALVRLLLDLLTVPEDPMTVTGFLEAVLPFGPSDPPVRSVNYLGLLGDPGVYAAGSAEGLGTDFEGGINPDDYDETVNFGLVVDSDGNTVASGAETSPAVLRRQVYVPSGPARLEFDYHFENGGDGDALELRANGDVLWSMVGTNYAGQSLQPSGPIDLAVYAGNTADLGFRLVSVGMPNAVVWVDNVNLYSSGAVSGTVWRDHDGDGDRDQNDEGMADEVVFLDLNGDGALDVEEPSTTTSHDDPATSGIDETGQYVLGGQTVGALVVAHIAGDGHVVSNLLGRSSQIAFLQAGETIDGYDFGVREATPPTAIGVSITGAAWSQSFLDHLSTEGLGEGGYSVPAGSAAQLEELPWNNVDQVRITFSEDVVVVEGDLAVYGVSVPQYAFSGFGYDAGTHTATWTLVTPAGADKLLLVLSDDVADAAGNALDGDWSDEVSSYPSGDGSPGGDFRFRFNVLPGDVDQSGDVRSSDTIKVRRKSNTAPDDPDYSVFYDVDGNGEIRSSDTIKVRRKSNTELPSGEPVVPPATAVPAGDSGGWYPSTRLKPGASTRLSAGEAGLIAAAFRAAQRGDGDRLLLRRSRADALSMAEILPLVI